MNFDQLRDRVCASLQLRQPELDDASVLVDECLCNARKAFRDDFICQLSAEAWARITLIYHKHFLDTGSDVSVAEIVVAVLRDAITTNRMDMVTLKLAQQKQFSKAKDDRGPKGPTLEVVKD